MSTNVIQCPSCSKKYRLPDVPPATFQCRNCGTVMDLSAFQPEPQRAPVAPARTAAPGRGAPASGPTAPPPGSPPHRHGPVGGRRRGRVASHRARHGHGAGAEETYEDEGRQHYHRDRGPNTGLIIGSIAAVVIALVLLFVMMNSQKEKQPEPKPVAQQPAPVLPPPQDLPDDEEEEDTVKPPPKPPPGREDEARPELREGVLENVPIPEGKRNYRASQAEIQTYDWPAYVSAEDRNQIEAAIEKLWWGGRDMTEAQDFLVGLDKYPTPGTEFRAVGRVISEFKHVLERRDNDMSNPMTMADLMVLDRILRRVDGMQERDFSDREGITHATTDSHAKTVMKRWNWWYDLEKWRMRRPPWDVSEDLLDPDQVEDGADDEEDLPPR